MELVDLYQYSVIHCCTIVEQSSRDGVPGYNFQDWRTREIRFVSTEQIEKDQCQKLVTTKNSSSP